MTKRLAYVPDMTVQSAMELASILSDGNAYEEALPVLNQWLKDNTTEVDAALLLQANQVAINKNVLADMEWKLKKYKGDADREWNRACMAGEVE